MFTYHMLIQKKHNTHKNKSKTNKQTITTTATNRTVKTTLNNERITGAVTASDFKAVTQMLQKSIRKEHSRQEALGHRQLQVRPALCLQSS